MADEIFSGDLSNYLLRPIKYYGYWLARTLAHRSILVVSGVLEIGLLSLLFQGQPLVVPTPVGVAQFLALLVLAVGIIQVIDFMAATLAIWTGRAFGPRFVTYGILIPFLSGAFVPLDILPYWARTALAWTPFPLTAFAPLHVPRGEVRAVARRLLETLPVDDVLVEEASIDEVVRDIFRSGGR
jgi:ABC-2 type transport system permease protein